MFWEKGTLKAELKIQIISKINSVLRKTDKLNANATIGSRISKHNDICHNFQALPKNCDKRLLASSCLSVRMKQFGSHWTDLMKFEDFSKICRENSSFIKTGRE